MIKFTLKDTLDDYDITGYQLSVESKVRNNTIYNYMNNEAKNIKIAVLGDIIKALRKLTKDNTIDIEHVFIYEEAN